MFATYFTQGVWKSLNAGRGQGNFNIKSSRSVAFSHEKAQMCVVVGPNQKRASIFLSYPLSFMPSGNFFLYLTDSGFQSMDDGKE